MKKYLGFLVFVHITSILHTQAQPTQQTATANLLEQTSQTLTSPVFISDHPDDVFWDDRFTLDSPNGPIFSMIIDEEGSLYVGGGFSTVGNKIARLLAQWDGSSWSRVGEGIQLDPLGGDVPFISSLVIDSSGTLYAGGNNLADAFRGDDVVVKWDGNTWSSIGIGKGLEFALVRTLATDKAGNLYAGGYITQEDASPHIVKWEGMSWSALGDGLNREPFALAVDGDDNVYAGGRFDSAGTMVTNKIAKWDGASWSSLGQGIEGRIVAELAIDANDNLYVGGLFDSAGGMIVNNIAKWNGTSWSSLGDGLNDHVSALAINEEGELFAGGSFDSTGSIAVNHIAKWDGESWSSLGEGLDGAVNELAIDEQGRLFAAGLFNFVNGELANGIAMWDGVQWTPLNKPTGSGLKGGVNSLAANENGDLYVGGGFTAEANSAVKNIGRWDGVSWSALGEGVSGSVAALVLGEEEDLYVAGNFDLAGGIGAKNIAKWNGAEWSPLAEGLNGRARALAFDGNGSLYAGGDIDSAGVLAVNNIAKWDGTAWSSLGEGIEGGSFLNIYALALDANDNLFVGGEFETAGGNPAKNIAMWDGTSWSEVGGGLYDDHTRGGVRALRFDDDGNLYAGGSFTKSRNKQVFHIAKWDGFQWDAVGSGFNTVVLSLETDENGDVYAGGQFNGVINPFRDNFNRIARWDGVDWFQLGSGLRGYPRSLALDGRGNLYAGGAFTIAGNKPSAGIARWDIREAAIASSVDPLVENQLPYILTSAYPNPFREHTTLEITVNEPQHLVISVYDASGRQIRLLFDGLSLPQQAHKIRLDGIGLASGTYFVHAHGESFSQSQAVTFIK